MPKSKGRQKRKSSGYNLAPARKKRHKGSPRWYGPAILAVMGVGVFVIVANYMGIMPGDTKPLWLFAGLGLIALGFVGTMFWY
jgi:Cell division protein CrgA